MGFSGVENSQITVGFCPAGAEPAGALTLMSLSESDAESPSGNTAHIDEMKPLGTFSPSSRSEAGSRYDWSSAVL